MKIITLFFALSSMTALADNFCMRTNLHIKDLLNKQSSRLNFANSGGLFNGGVCWWHSRMQRASVYLAKYRPELAKPNANQLASILRSLSEMSRVVEIPGYSNFRDFSRENQKAIQRTLEAWQRVDGFINQQWIRGISGSSTLPADQLERKMHNIFQGYQQSPTPIWLMAQMKGIVAHSFLLVEMNEVQNGFKLKVIDSNRPTLTREINYQVGSRSLNVFGDSTQFIPYTGFQNDFQKIKRAIDRYCKASSVKLMSIPMGDFELN